MQCAGSRLGKENAAAGSGGGGGDIGGEGRTGLEWVALRLKCLVCQSVGPARPWYGILG